MKHFNYFFSLLVFIGIISCSKESELVSIENESIQIQSPSTVHNGISESQSLVDISGSRTGGRYSNPYYYKNIVQAYQNLFQRREITTVYTNLFPDKLYVRFLPADHEEMFELEADNTFELFDYPLDNMDDLQGTNSYHDPNLDDDQYTYQYTVVDVTYNFPNIYTEILDTLFINSGGSVVVSDSDWFLIEEEAFSITNTPYVSSDPNMQWPFSCNEWNPSGYIKVHDDVQNGFLPVERAKVVVNRWFKYASDYTDENGYFYIDKDYCHSVRYKVKWETGDYDIRDGAWGQAKTYGPISNGSWTKFINSNPSKDLNFATIQRAANRYHYGEIDGLKRPDVWLKLKYCYYHESNSSPGENWGNWDFTGLHPDILIYGYGGSSFRDTDVIFSVVVHETAHASHIELMNAGEIQFGQVDKIIYESWADAVEWKITKMEYNSLGFSNYDNPEIEFSTTNDHKQWWDTTRSHDYTPLFIDLEDDFNQSLLFNSITLPVDRCPEGGVFVDGECVIGTPPTGESAFIYNDHFYYSPINCCDCPLTGSYYDGANCYYQDIPDDFIGRISDNSWILLPEGDRTYPYDEVANYTLAEIEENVLKKTYGLSSLKTNLKTNKPTNVTDKEIDVLLDIFFDLN